VRRLAGGGSKAGRSSTELLDCSGKTMTKGYAGQWLVGQVLVGCGLVSPPPYFFLLLFLFFSFIFCFLFSFLTQFFYFDLQVLN
jgi:hypothetical protein